MTTRRERMERRLERREEWAQSRDRKAAERQAAADQVANMIPLGQPILTDHYSARTDTNRRNRMSNNYSKAREHRDMANHHRSKADGIARQLKTSIYSDDHDAIEQLEARIADLEAQRERIKAFNKAARKLGDNPTDEALAATLAKHLTKKEANDYLTTRRVAPYQIRNNAMPGYHLTNLGGNINRNKKRLAKLRAERTNDHADE